MPVGFNKCRSAGGRIRTVKPSGGTYMPVCFLGGKSYHGEVHHKKAGGGGGRSTKLPRAHK
jgi:hypothetical protein